MEENEEYDSDSTVLLTDFANKPQKIDVKRRRFSHLQDCNKQSGQLNENNATPNNPSENIHALRGESRDWRITNFFSRINETNNNIRNNGSDVRRNEEIEPNRAPDCQTNPGNILKGNTAGLDNKDNNIVCLDSDEEMENEKTQNVDQNSIVITGINIAKLIVLKPAAINARRATVNCAYDEKSQNRDINTDKNSLANNHINSSKLIVLKPAAINARRASINCVSQRQEEKKPARLEVLQPSVINGRRATTHFGEIISESSLTNENNFSIKGNEESGKDKQADKDCDNLQSTIANANTISNTSPGSSYITDVYVETQGVNSLSYILPVSSNPSNTIVCHNSATKDLRQDAVNNTVLNVKAHKRFGNIESQIEPKRIKTNINQNIPVLPSTVLYKNIDENNEQPQVSEGEKGKDGEHVKRLEPNSKSWPLAGSSATLENNSAHVEEVLNSGTLNKECTDKDTNITNIAHVEQISVSPIKQKNSKAQAEEVRSEGHENLTMTAIIDEPMTNNNLETRHATDCRGTGKVQDEQEASDQHETSEIQEDQDANKGRDKLQASDVSENAQDTGIIDVQNQQKVNNTFDQHETRNKHDKTATNEEIINGVENSGDSVEKTIGNETNGKQDTSKVFNDREPSESVVDHETNKVQEKQVTCNKIFLQTTDQEQETIQNRGEFEVYSNKEKQILNTAIDYHETGKLQDKHITSERLATEDLSNEQYKDLTSIAPEEEIQKVSSEQITFKSKSSNEQETDQQNKAITENLNACVVDNERMLKFQRWFFTKIIENLTEIQNNIMDTNPESAIMLKSIIKTLIDATNRTDVEYSCPKCGCVSNYSSGLLDNTESDGGKPAADNSQNCHFCWYIRKLHTTYLKRYLNKKDRIVNNEEAVRITLGDKDHAAEHSKSSGPEVGDTHSSTIPKENTFNNLVSNSEANDSISNLTVENEKQIHNFTSTQSCSKTRAVNHNVSKEHIIDNEATCVQTSKRYINSEINVISNETNSNSVALKKLSDTEMCRYRDTSIKQTIETTGDTKLTGSHVNEVVSILDKLIINNKRTNTDEQEIRLKRMKTATENNISQNDHNLKTKDNPLYSTTARQSEFSIIENNKKDYQPTDINYNSPDDLPTDKVRAAQSVTTESSKNSNLISPAVVGTAGSHNNGECNSTVNSDTAEKTSNESLSQRHSNTTNISIAETDNLKSKSDNTNEVANENAIELCSQKVRSMEDSTNSIKKAGDQCDKEIITESNVSQTDSRVRNTEENQKGNETLLTSLVDCITQLKNISKKREGNHVKGLAKNKPLLKLVSKENVSCDKFSSRATYSNLVVKYKYVCPHCTSIYTHASKLLQHMKQQHNLELKEVPEKSIKLKCPFCKKLLLHHYNKHVMRCSVLEHSNANRAENKNHSLNENKGNISEGNIKISKTAELTKFKYDCAVCDTSLSSAYAARQHRKQIHPEFKHRHIIKRTRIGDKVSKQNISEIKRNDKAQTSKPHDDLRTNAALDTDDDDEYISTDEFTESNTSSEGEDSASDAISLTDIYSQNTTNSDRSWSPRSNQDASCNEDEDDCDSDESSVSSETSEAENNDRCDKNKTKTMKVSKEGTSTHSKGSHGAENRKKYVFKCLICNTILYSDYASRKHRANQHPKMRGVPIFKKIKEGETDENALKSNKLNRKKRKTLLGNTSSPSDNVADIKQSNNKRDDKVSQIYKHNISENTSDSDWSTVSNLDCTEDSSLGSCSDEETANKDEHTSKTIRERSNTKRRKRAVPIKKYTGNEDSSDSDWIISTDESVDTDGSYLNIDEVALPGSEDEALKSSTSTVRKRKERLSKLFGDENDTDVEDDGQRVRSKNNVDKLSTILNHSDNQCDSNKRNPTNFENEVHNDSSDDETIKVSERTINKIKERRSMFDDGIQQERNGSLIQSSTHVSTVNSNECNVEISKNKEDRYEAPAESSELKEDEYNPGHCEEENTQPQNKETCCKTSEDCDMDPVTCHNSSIKTSNESNTIVSNNVILNHYDRIEIDLINGLLDEYNSQTPEDQQSNSNVVKESNGKDDREPNISDAQSPEANIDIDSQASLPSGKITNCFENIQITNVRSISKKILIFICQECSFATDTYDDTIRHCQNHFNNIEDPVTYCNICQVKYDTTCFNRHQTWHDKCLISYKIKFSFQWLFSNWHAVFENKNISLREAEEIPVKSIYKTHCIKMTVKESGPWQSALYLCAKCNTCVSPRDIEKHIHNNCISKNYLCTLCDHAFLTLEMLEHHKIYHEDGITLKFKTVVFNDENDESFNSKLIQAKLQAGKNKQMQLNVDIYKCMCGLCFNSLKKFKLHFVDCDTQTNNGVKCSRCPGERRFLSTDLEEHFSLHHSLIKYAIRVKQIIFQQECDYNSSELESVSKSTEKTTDNATQLRPNDVDINIEKDMLKADSILHGNINVVEKDLEIIRTAENAVRPISIDEVLNIERHILKDESFSQNTNGENMQENIDIDEGDLDNRYTAQHEAQMSIDKELTIKKNLLKDRPLSQIMSGEYSQRDVNVVVALVADTNIKSTTENVTQVTRKVKDLNIKKDMLKCESFSQNSNPENMQDNVEENLQYEGTAVNVAQTTIDTDIHIKKDMLKDETLSQGTIEELMQENVDIFEGNLNTSTVERGSVALVAINEDLNIKKDMLKDELLSQGTIEEIMQKNVDIFEKNLDTSAVESVALIATDKDLNIKRDMLKDESLSQNSVEERTQEILDTFEANLKTSTVESVALIDKDLNIKRDMLKDESLSQNSVEEFTNTQEFDIVDENLINDSIAENPTNIIHIDEDLNDITDTTKYILQENNKGKKPESPNTCKQQEVEMGSRNIDSEPIVIDSDDDDVEVIEDPNEFKFARRRARSGSILTGYF